MNLFEVWWNDKPCAKEQFIRLGTPLIFRGQDAVHETHRNWFESGRGPLLHLFFCLEVISFKTMEGIQIEMTNPGAIVFECNKKLEN